MMLFAYILGSNSDPFPVDIDKSKTVGELKEAIWNKDPHFFEEINARNLKLYSVELTTAEVRKKTARDFDGKDELDPTENLLNCFGADPPSGRVHTVVKFPYAFRESASISAQRPSKRPRLDLDDAVANLTDQDSGLLHLYDLLWKNGFSPFANRSYNILSLKIDGSVLNDELGNGIYDAFDPEKIPTSAEFESIEIPNSEPKALMPLFRRSILVRKAYPDILEMIMEDPSPCVVLGQPGIGKTFFLTYVLVLRLLKNEPTTYQYLVGKVHWFSSRGFQTYAPGDLPPAALTEETWHLVDSNEYLKVPHERYSEGPGKVVVASSPKEERYKEWSKQKTASQIWTEPVDWCEMSVIASRFTPSMTEEMLNDLPRVFHKYGRSARTCLITAGNPRNEKKHEDKISEALGELKQSPVFYRHPASVNTKVSHTLWSVIPDPTRITSSITPASHYISSRIFEVARDEQAVIAASMADIFLSTPYLRPSAGRLIEPYIIATLQIMEGIHKVRPFPPRRKIKELELEPLGNLKLSSLYFSDIRELPQLAKKYPGKVLAPRARNFPTIDAMMFRGDETWLFQVTIAAKHPLTTTGFDLIKKTMKFFNPTRKKWKVVIVTLEGEEIEGAPVTGDGKKVWEKKIELYTLTLSRK